MVHLLIEQELQVISRPLLRAEHAEEDVGGRREIHHLLSLGSWVFWKPV
jgi:hypothetical protein